jgi:hypothetical protein
MGQVRLVAEMIYIEDGDYENVCSSNPQTTILGADTNLQILEDEITNKGTGLGCETTTTTHADYCVDVTLPGGDTWCVSSAGNSTRGEVCAASAVCE